VRRTIYRITGLFPSYLFGQARVAAMPTRLVYSIFLFILLFPLIRLFRRRDLLLWVLWSAGTIGFVAAIDMLRQTTMVGYVRYTILASPAVYAVIAAFDWPRRRFIRYSVAITTIGLLAILAVQRSINIVPAEEDWRTLSHDLSSVAGPEDLLVFYNNDPWVTPGTWYMGFKFYSPDSHRPWVVLKAPADEQLMRQIGSRRIVWLVGRFPEMQGSRVLPGWAPAYAEVRTTAGAFCPMIPLRRPSANGP
jgi:hypothetical protein